MRKIGYIQTLAASIGFGFLGYFGKMWIQTGSDTQSLIAFRFCVATALYALIILFYRRDLFRISKQQLFICISLGLFGYALFATLYFKAITGLSIALASLLLNTHPLILTLISAFLLKTKLTKFHWIACLLGTMGLGLFLWGEVTFQSPWAAVAGLGSALSYACYLLISSRYQGRDSGIHPMTSSFYVIITTAIVLCVTAGVSPLDLPKLSGLQFQIILGIAVISTVIPLTLVLAGLQKIKSHEAALLSMAEPLTASLISWILLADEWNLQKFLGAGLVIFSILLPTYSEYRESKKTVQL